MAGGFFKTESTRTTIVFGDCGMPAKEVAPSWLTVPEKTMLDCLASSAWLFCVCVNAVMDGPSMAVQRMPAKKLDEIFMCASPCFARWREALQGITGTLK